MEKKAQKKIFHNNAEISEDFWDEVHSRGFFVEHENGGRKYDDYNNCSIKRITTEVFRMSSLSCEDGVAFISPDLFMKTVRKIENMLNYKLFM